MLKKGGSVDDCKALLKGVVRPSDIIRTGKNSRAELEFPDGTICRLGSNTIFSFDPMTRDMAFPRGVALVHVPPHKGGAQILTPSAMAQLKGDTVVLRTATMTDGSPITQFTALSPQGGSTDGNIVITLNRNPNISFSLAPGQVAIVPQNATSFAQIPQVEIDVGTFAAHSSIMRHLPQSAELEINSVANAQDRALASGAAQRTEFAIVGDRVVRFNESGNLGTHATSATPTPLPAKSAQMTEGRITKTDSTQTKPNGIAAHPDGKTMSVGTHPSALGTSQSGGVVVGTTTSVLIPHDGLATGNANMPTDIRSRLNPTFPVASSPSDIIKTIVVPTDVKNQSAQVSHPSHRSPPRR